MKRDFREPINMGNGDKSQGECYKLIKRLEEGFSIHSGLQQGQGFLSKEVMDYDKKRLTCIIMDINTALGDNAIVQLKEI